MGMLIPQVVRDDPQLNSIRESIEADRPYRFPKGYQPWRAIASVFALALGSPEPSAADQTSRLLRYGAGRWLGLNAPAYCVQTALLRQLEQTDIPYDTKLLAGISLLPSALFLLPENALQTPEGASVNWFLASFSDLESPLDATYRHWRFPQSQHEAGVIRNLGAALLDTQGTVWWVGNKVDADGTLRRSPARSLGLSPLKAEEIEWMQSITDLTLQLILLASSPDGNVDLEAIKTPGGGDASSPPKKKAERFWRPRFLRLEDLQDERPRRARASSQGPGGTHSSPRTHWRRGHWRNQPVGAGRQGRELRWIRPVLVKPT